VLAFDIGVGVGVGAAIAGAVRESDGMVRFAPNLGWADEPLGAALARGLRRHGVRASRSDWYRQGSARTRRWSVRRSGPSVRCCATRRARSRCSAPSSR
jgi:hypothetical protein